MLDTVRNMYTKTRCKVHTGNTLSPVISNHKGGVLSPFLFWKYLCDPKNYLDEAIGIQIDTKIIAYLIWADNLFKSHLQYVYDKATKAMYIILYSTKELGRIPVRTVFTCLTH